MASPSLFLHFSRQLVFPCCYLIRGTIPTSVLVLVENIFTPFIYIYVCLQVHCARPRTPYASPITSAVVHLEHWLLFGALLWGVALSLGMADGASSAYSLLYHFFMLYMYLAIYIHHLAYCTYSHFPPILCYYSSIKFINCCMIEVRGMSYALCVCLVYLLLVKYKWRVVLSIVMERQFHCLCSLSTGGVHGHFEGISQWPSHCSTDTSWAVWREPAAQKEGKVLYDEWLVTISWCGKWWCETRTNLCCDYFTALQLFFAPILYILHVHSYWLFLRILHVQMHSACMCSSGICVHRIFKYGGASLWQAPLGPSCLSCIERCP